MARSKKERKIGKHTEEEMRAALELKKNGSSLREASRTSNIPYATLRRYFIKQNEAGQQEVRLTPNYEINQIFSLLQEKSLLEYLFQCAYCFYGLTNLDCRQVAFQMAKINDIKVPNAWDQQKLAGVEWLRSFRRRHPELTLRSPERCSLARATSFNRANVEKFFDNLHKIIDRVSAFSDGTRIFNLDETSTTTVQRPQKVLAPKGIRCLSKITSGEKGTLVTTCCIISASGQSLPPAVIFPRVHFKSHMTNGTPPGTLGLANPSGWMNTDLFVEVMKHYIKHSSSSLLNPSLLIFDNHESHLSLEVLNLAKKNGVTILTLPPHTTHKTQPLDVGVMKPFKDYYNAAMDSWLLRNPGKPVTIYEVGGLVGEAYQKAMTPATITNAFRRTGIFPFDRNVFSEIDFAPSSVTDRLIQSERTLYIVDNSVSDIENQEVTNQREIIKNNIISATSTTTVEPSEQDSSKREHDSSFILHAVPGPSHTTQTGPCLSSPEARESELESNTYMEVDSPSTPPRKTSFISPKDFRPAMKAGPRKNTINRKKGKSLIATDTPELNQIALEKESKKRKHHPKLKSAVKKVLQDTSSESEISVILESDNDLSDSDFIDVRDTQMDRKLTVGDHVLVKFLGKKSVIYYVAKIEEDKDSCYSVSFLRRKGTGNMFFPICPIYQK